MTQAGMPKELRTFYEPQAEQLELKLAPHALGQIARCDTPQAQAWLWVAPLGEHCLLSAHAVRPKQPMLLVEQPTAYGCITSVSRATARECSPSAVPSHVKDRGNVLAFSQPAGTVSCMLGAGRLYEARNICFTPGYFHDLARRHGSRFATLLERFDQIDPDLLPPQLDQVMQAVDPQVAATPRAGLLLEARVGEALYLVAGCLDEQERALQDDATRGQRSLVRKAKRLIDADFRNPPSLEQLAAALFVSRARLCAAFKQETGTSPGAYARARRLRHACRLLAETDLPVAQVAHEAGYRNAGSFTEAFGRELGCAPTAWRREHR